MNLLQRARCSRFIVYLGTFFLQTVKIICNGIETIRNEYIKMYRVQQFINTSRVKCTVQVRPYI